MVRMVRTNGPSCIDESVMKELLDMIDDLAYVRSPISGIQPAACGDFNDGRLVSTADGDSHVRQKE